MNPNHAPDGLPPLSQEELQALEIRWYEGRMLPYVEWIFAFATKHRDEILRTAGPDADAGLLVATVRRMIAQRGSMHLAAELKDQMREMEKELWYRGEKDPRARAEIKQQWTAHHAAAWRRWRIQEYLFVANLCGERLVEQLRDAPKGKS